MYQLCLTHNHLYKYISYNFLDLMINKLLDLILMIFLDFLLKFGSIKYNKLNNNNLNPLHKF